jgi:Acyl-CoA dehydrogenase, middle domain
VPPEAAGEVEISMTDLAMDYLGLDALLSAEELAWRDTVRAFVVRRWIGLASIADTAVIWARTQDGIRGFLVPAGTAGFTATPIEPKLAMRASIQCDITVTDVRVPADAALPAPCRGHR